jgi:hypothetical protein
MSTTPPPIHSPRDQEVPYRHLARCGPNVQRKRRLNDLALEQIDRVVLAIKLPAQQHSARRSHIELRRRL